MSVNNAGSVVLSKLLIESNLEVWGKLQRDYLHTTLQDIHTVVAKHCDKFNKLPTFAELKLEFREGGLQKNIIQLEQLETTDIDIDVALDALVNEYTQNEALKLMSVYLDKLPLLDASETKEGLAEIVLKLDEKTYADSAVVIGADFTIFESPEVTKENRIILGFSNKFDADIAAFAEELILIGGMRGSGKSIICTNIQVNQYQQGFICPYFTIEMKAAEVVHRSMAVLAEVPHRHIRQNTLSFEEEKRIAFVKSDMFNDGLKYYEEFLVHRDRYKFELDLKKYGNAKLVQLITVDDRKLTLAALDMHIGKLKAQYGDLLKVVVVDYVNQIVPMSTSKDSKFDWKPQVEVATQLKNYARKYNICMVSPYQIDSSGEARFSKAILDPVDVAMTLHQEAEGISFNITKVRGGSPIKFASGFDRSDLTTLYINPSELILESPASKEDNKDAPWATKSEAANELM